MSLSFSPIEFCDIFQKNTFRISLSIPYPFLKYSNYHHSVRKKWPYSELFWSAFSRIQFECGKIRTKVIPNTDTFYVVLLYQKEALRGLLKLKKDSASDILLVIVRYFQISYTSEHMLLLENTC